LYIVICCLDVKITKLMIPSHRLTDVKFKCVEHHAYHGTLMRMNWELVGLSSLAVKKVTEITWQLYG